MHKNKFNTFLDTILSIILVLLVAVLIFILVLLVILMFSVYHQPKSSTQSTHTVTNNHNIKEDQYEHRINTAKFKSIFI